MMDLNELLYQQQRAIRDAGRFASLPHGSRFDLVNYYARRIRDLQAALGATATPVWLHGRAAR